MTGPRRPSRRPDILYADDRLLAADKPSGFFMARRGGDAWGFPELLSNFPEIRPDEPFAIVNRLHEHASGVAVYARREDDVSALRGQFETGLASATYLALVNGYVEDDGEITLSLHYDKRTARVWASEKAGKPALTKYRVLERVAGNTLLECRPERDQFDQVRAHLAAAGHPLTIDPAYGGGTCVMLSEYKPAYRSSSRRPERPLTERLTLHCSAISLLHPFTRERISITAPLAKDLRATLKQLGRL